MMMVVVDAHVVGDVRPGGIADGTASDRADRPADDRAGRSPEKPVADTLAGRGKSGRENERSGERTASENGSDHVISPNGPNSQPRRGRERSSATIGVKFGFSVKGLDTRVAQKNAGH